MTKVCKVVRLFSEHCTNSHWYVGVCALHSLPLFTSTDFGFFSLLLKLVTLIFLHELQFHRWKTWFRFHLRPFSQDTKAS